MTELGKEGGGNGDEKLPRADGTHSDVPETDTALDSRAVEMMMLTVLGVRPPGENTPTQD